jgi:hypothetical protein
MTLYRQHNIENVPLHITQTCIKLVQKCTLTSVFGQYSCSNTLNVDFLLDFSQNSVLMDIHVNKLDVAFSNIIAGAFRLVWR